MKRIIALTIFLACAGSAFASGGGSSSKPLTGSYPIVLSHGLFGWGDTDGSGLISIVNYWGGMDSYLKSQGARVYAPGKSPTQSNEVRAGELKTKINYWMAANGYTKVNIMGHSQGGLDSRYMISNLGMSSKVRVLTTISTPHRGSPIADILSAAIPSWLQPFVGAVVQGLVYIAYGGATQQDALAAMASLTKAGLTAFNSYTPNASATRYYSYGSYMTWADPIQHPLMFLIYPACAAGGLFQGQGASNDGLVPYSSQQWGTWKGKPSYSIFTSGVDHLQASNSLNSGNLWYDVEGFYLTMATNAMNNQ